MAGNICLTIMQLYTEDTTEETALKETEKKNIKWEEQQRQILGIAQAMVKQRALLGANLLRLPDGTAQEASG